MGNCRSTTEASAPNNSVNLRHNGPNPNSAGGAVSASTANASPPSDSTAALIQALLPTVLPVVCQVASQNCIADPSLTVLKNEEPLTEYDETTPLEEQVVRDIQLQISQIKVVDAETLLKDMTKMPSFAWPERERAQTLMHNNTNAAAPGNDDGMMTVVDIVDFHIKVLLGKGIEFAIPVENPLKMKMTLEVGCGGKKIGNDAWFEVTVPRLRLWITQRKVAIGEQSFTNTTRTRKQVKAYVAFIGRPDLKPHVNVNADRGKGDFFQLDLDETGSLDDFVESILMGFGPSEYYELEQNEHAKTNKALRENKSSSDNQHRWVGNALGKHVSLALGSWVGMGNNRPYELDLTDAVTSAIDAAMGKPRPVEIVKEDIQRLEKELERSQQAEKDEAVAAKQPAAARPMPASHGSEDEKKDDEYNLKTKNAVANSLVDQLEYKILAPFTACCGE